MKTIELNKTVWVVEVPKDIEYIELIYKETIPLFLLIKLKGVLIPTYIDLGNPKGNWKILSLDSEMTEELAKTIMPFVGLPWCAYKDYTSNKNWFTTALESYQSCIKSLYGEQVVELVILIKEG